jgi:rhodanese-related sulfurtransferase
MLICKPLSFLVMLWSKLSMKTFKLIFVFFILMFVFLGFNCAHGSALEKTTADIAFNLFDENKAVIIDVRELDEQSRGRIRGTLSLPMSVMDNDKSLFEKIIATYPKNKKIIVYCFAGVKSDLVGTELLKKGFQVLNLGAFKDWSNKGYPVEVFN